MTAFASRLLGSSGSSTEQEHCIEENWDEVDDQERTVTVKIVGGGLMSHWASVWEFSDGQTRVAELSATNPNNGKCFSQIRGVYHQAQSLDSFMVSKGYSEIENFQSLPLTTSPEALQGKVRNHRLNGTMYDITSNNCQAWIIVLLTEGYGVSLHALPLTWANIAKEVGLGAGLVVRGGGGIASSVTGIVASSGRAGASVVGGATEAASGASVAARALGPVGGGLVIVTAAVDIGFAVHDLLQGHPTTATCDILHARVDNVRNAYTSEPQSPELDVLLKVFHDQKGALETLNGSIFKHHCGSNGARIGGNGLSVAGGACLVAAPFTLGSTAVVGAFLWAGGMLTNGSCLVANSWRGLEFRHNVIESIENMTRAQKRYALSTGRMQDGLMGSPGQFVFSVPSTKWCQFYMTVVYTTHDGHRVEKLSCDQGRYGWYGDDVIVDPGATDVEVSFDVRGGRQLYAVDRSVTGLPWIEPFRREVFHFEQGDGVSIHFELAGTSLHAYVCAMQVHREVDHFMNA